MAAMGDMADIKQVEDRYRRALDTKNWADFAATLTHDVISDFGEALGGTHRFTGRDRLVDHLRTSLGKGVITEHRGGPPRDHRRRRRRVI